MIDNKIANIVIWLYNLRFISEDQMNLVTILLYRQSSSSEKLNDLDDICQKYIGELNKIKESYEKYKKIENEIDDISK